MDSVVLFWIFGVVTVELEDIIHMHVGHCLSNLGCNESFLSWLMLHLDATILTFVQGTSPSWCTVAKWRHVGLPM